jgi:hypothetical protein
MNSIEDYMRAEKFAESPCRLTVTLLKTGEFRARLSFAAGMQTAHGDGITVADAIERLENELSTGH